MLPAQEAYFELLEKWFGDKTDIHLFSRILAARRTFDDFGLATRIEGLPAYSVFVLMTAMGAGNINSNFTNALLASVKYLMDNEGEFTPRELADKFAKDFNLSDTEKSHLKSIIEKEKKILDSSY